MNGLPTSGRSTRKEVLGLAIVVEGGLGLLAVIAGWIVGFDPLRTFAFGFLAVGIGVVATLPLLGLFFVSIRVRWEPLTRIRRFFDEFVRPLFAGCRPLDLALVAVLAGIGEELLFRGLLQGLLTDRLGAPAGVLLASVIFGLVHPITRTYVVIVGCIGIYLGLLWIVSGDLLAPMVAHSLYDFVALIWLLRLPPATTQVPADVPSPNEEETHDRTWDVEGAAGED